MKDEGFRVKDLGHLVVEDMKVGIATGWQGGGGMPRTERRGEGSPEEGRGFARTVRSHR